MRIFYGINQITNIRKPVVALGVFDGVHLGHRKILEAAIKEAAKINGTSVVVTFDPHPQREESLYSLKHRLSLIAELGIGVCIVISFNKSFAKIKAEDFIKDILLDRIRAIKIIVGKDFRFGCKASGDLKTLEQLARRFNFKTKGFNIEKINGKVISSTLIRNLIKKGNIKEAERLLGKQVSILGSVIKGRALGRILGFPTANINPHHEIIPPVGIYAVKVKLGSKEYKGVCYIGKKPTLKNLKGKSQNSGIGVEVYIFNFNKNIYGKDLEIKFVKKFRKDKKFKNLSLLKQQIKKDVYLARKFLS